MHIHIYPDEVNQYITTILSHHLYDLCNHFSATLSIGSVINPPSPPIGKDLSLSPQTIESNYRTNGLRLNVWPQLVDGLAGEVGNFTISIADPACDHKDGCKEVEDEVGALLYKMITQTITQELKSIKLL